MEGGEKKEKKDKRKKREKERKKKKKFFKKRLIFGHNLVKKNVFQQGLPHPGKSVNLPVNGLWVKYN